MHHDTPRNARRGTPRDRNRAITKAILTLPATRRARALATWWALTTFTSRENPAIVWPSRRTLADATGASLNSVILALADLRTCGLVISRHRTRGNEITGCYYYLVPLGNSQHAPWDNEHSETNTTNTAQAPNTPALADTRTSPVRDLPRPRQAPQPAPARASTRPTGSTHTSSTPTALSHLASHPHDENVRQALIRLRVPLPVPEVLTELTRIGAGDPWRGYLEARQSLTERLGDARDVERVLRARLRDLTPVHTPETPTRCAFPGCESGWVTIERGGRDHAMRCPDCNGGSWADTELNAACSAGQVCEVPTAA